MQRRPVVLYLIVNISYYLPLHSVDRQVLLSLLDYIILDGLDKLLAYLFLLKEFLFEGILGFSLVFLVLRGGFLFLIEEDPVLFLL